MTTSHLLTPRVRNAEPGHDDRKRYRHKARFWHTSDCQMPLSRDDKTRIMVAAECLERRTRGRGCINGTIGQPGLRVLRVMLWTYHNSRSGRCDPSYQGLRKATDLSRQSIAVALKRLEAAGILKIMRRLQRCQVTRRNPVTGQKESYVGTTQARSAYIICQPYSGGGLLRRLDTTRLKFPPLKPKPNGQFDPDLWWWQKLGLKQSQWDREKEPQIPTTQSYIRFSK